MVGMMFGSDFDEEFVIEKDSPDMKAIEELKKVKDERVSNDDKISVLNKVNEDIKKGIITKPALPSILQRSSEVAVAACKSGDGDQVVEATEEIVKTALTKDKKLTPQAFDVFSRIINRMPDELTSFNVAAFNRAASAFADNLKKDVECYDGYQAADLFEKMEGLKPSKGVEDKGAIESSKEKVKKSLNKAKDIIVKRSVSR